MTTKTTVLENVYHDVYYDHQGACWFCLTCDIVVCTDSGPVDEEADRPICPNDHSSEAS
jgi:hypothetical protein